MTGKTSPRTYVFDPGSVDRERLKLAADRLNEDTLGACGRASVQSGDRALDVGCGPGGALSLMAVTVGASGVVIGLDNSEEALAAAQDSLAAQGGFPNVHLVRGDINLLPADTLAEWGPFDVALCRLLFTHQLDPAATLRAVARAMRPGGRIIAIDPLRNACFPRLDPPVGAISRILELDVAHLQHRSLASDVAWEYGNLCNQCGLRLLDWRGTVMMAMHDGWQLKFVRRLLQAQQKGLIEAGLTTQSEIDGLVAEVDGAFERGVYRWASSIMVTMIAEVPGPRSRLNTPGTALGY